MRGFSLPVGDKPLVNIVRPLGGKARDGKKLVDEDTYKWNGREYVYDWAPIKQQINNVNKRAKVYQLLIDNPPWAFLRGVDLKGEKEVETYGNAWPPNDPEAWASYIEALLKELVKTYGKRKVERWRFCIGREIGTAGHWRGSRRDFFEHYKNTEKVIRAVLPKAKVGTHFLWASSKNSYGPDFIKWCKRNDAQYDFIGVSYYPIFNKPKRVDLDYVYNADFAPIKDASAWNDAATLEIHEFSLIESMSKRGNSFDNAPRAHVESFTVMLAKMMYDNGVVDVFRWGTGEGKLAEQEFLKMEGSIYYRSSRRGSPTRSGNMVDAVFAHDPSRRQYNVMVASYNANPNASSRESVKIQMTLPDPLSANIKYRKAVCNGERLDWTDWERIETESLSGGKKSRLKIDLNLAPFSFQKLEFKSDYKPSKETELAKTRTTRVLTQRATGKKVEAELVDMKSVSDLSDDDQEFLKRWAAKK
jgi:hypothetical protein